MIIIIDNYDSFTYNLYQYIGEIQPEIEVFRNDAISVEALREMKPSHIIISPGPGFPKSAGISKSVIAELGKETPILGICLGHQAIGEVFGAKVIHAETLFHGKTSMVSHNEKNLFCGIGSPFKVARYHSLVVDKENLPEELIVTARGPAGEIMALQHRKYPIFGLQFHPESIATEAGKKIIKKFLKIEK
ncbi:anthranilate synthase component II [Clostridium aceticum]|uniref:Anthranilate synthase component II n=1 Tax=Clostridium aceticum TaxID=84022 RepID=A0A0D8IF00_9CLOT|nr:aminodeoxychorismate/anthranilate synthase component II [Clostridium aceticum]AKL93951.1 anthranilate synthase component II [Clostridium aceticum]KJF28664.1 hypothetical protein TZ02_01825 [Clostridium aceticum]